MYEYCLNSKIKTNEDAKSNEDAEAKLLGIRYVLLYNTYKCKLIYN